jgi:hypothetical protein
MTKSSRKIYRLAGEVNVEAGEGRLFAIGCLKGLPMTGWSSGQNHTAFQTAFVFAVRLRRAMGFLEKYAYAPVSQKLQKAIIFQIDTENSRCYTCR